ncbi:hypothetical protein SAMN02910293_00456 [Streptococcus henryi]|uniref:Uncharacterized protein n=1 Tax=Streptococcus henryi TaxID=439219 RepID=A0A1G6AL21_9STRE|nr:hypothetical protein [Streptococcus henryi]QBX25352.1 hypothetical protein Javan252_0051 [Streptococcus phage Javan252]SDB09086.1 hypothetical protein SAMN02910293_00456 [Streptococcus henryi]
MDIIRYILVPAIVSLSVSIWFGRKLIAKTVEIMKKMDSDTQGFNQEMKEMVLDEIRRLKGHKTNGR